MSNLELNDGQEFFIGGQRYVVKDGVPVQEVKQGPLGGELVRFDSLKVGDRFALLFEKTMAEAARCLSPGFENMDYDGDNLGIVYSDLVEINVTHQARGRVMAAGDAAKLPDIVGKRVVCLVERVDPNDSAVPLTLSGLGWIAKDTQIEVLD